MRNRSALNPGYHTNMNTTPMKHVHMRIDLRGAIRNRSFSGYTDAEGRPLSAAAVERLLRERVDHGENFMLCGDPAECPDFNPVTGHCPGHDVEE